MLRINQSLQMWLKFAKCRSSKCYVSNLILLQLVKSFKRSSIPSIVCMKSF